MAGEKTFKLRQSLH